MVDISKGTTKKLFAVNYQNAMNKILDQSPDMPLKEAVPKAEDTANEVTQDQAAYLQDPVFYRNAEVLLATIVLLVVLGSLILIYVGKTPTDGVIAIGSGAVGALIGTFSAQR